MKSYIRDILHHYALILKKVDFRDRENLKKGKPIPDGRGAELRGASCNSTKGP